MKVETLMTRDVVTIGRNDPLREAHERMTSGRVRHLPVVEDGRLVGVLSQRDIVAAGLSSAMGYGEKAMTEFLVTVPVKEVMTDDVIAIGPKEDVKRAAALMLEHKIGCLPVVDGEELVGLITETDLLRTMVD